jgi:hypothetical protein
MELSMSPLCSCKGSVPSGGRWRFSRRKGDVDTRHMLAQRRHYACHACIRVKQAERKWIGCHRISATGDASQLRVVSSRSPGGCSAAYPMERPPNSMEKAVGLLGGDPIAGKGLSGAIAGTVGEFAWAGSGPPSQRLRQLLWTTSTYSSSQRGGGGDLRRRIIGGWLATDQSKRPTKKQPRWTSLPATPLWLYEYFKSHSALTPRLVLFRQIDEQFRKGMCWFLRSITMEKEDSGGPDAEIARPAKRTPFRPPQHSSSVRPARGWESHVRRSQTAWLDDRAKHGHSGHATSGQVTGRLRRRRANTIHWRVWLVTRPAARQRTTIDWSSVVCGEHSTEASTARRKNGLCPITRTGASRGRATHGDELDGLISPSVRLGEEETSR